MSLIIKENGTMIIDKDYEKIQIQNINQIIQDEETESKLEEIEKGDKNE